MSFHLGSVAVYGDQVAVQGGEHAGKTGTVRERLDDTPSGAIRLLVWPAPKASWTAFWIDADDVAVIR